MNKEITKAFDMLMERSVNRENENFAPFGRESSDGSRTFSDSMVVLAYELRGQHGAAYYYYLDTDRFTTDVAHFNQRTTTYFHSHNFLEISYVVEGTLRLIINDTVTEFQKGEVCIMDYSTRHAEKLDEEPVKILYFSLHPETFDEIMNSKKPKSHEQEFLKNVIHEKRNTYQYVHFIPNGDVTSVPDSILSILHETYEKKPGAPDIIRGHITRILNLLTTEYTPRLSSAEKIEMRRSLYYDICSYIKEHCRDVRIADLTEHFHYNTDFFNRLIKEFSGRTYTEFLHAERLSRAEKLLSETSLSVSAVADAIGYQNLGYFYKIFREKHGMQPSEYRRIYSEK